MNININSNFDGGNIEVVEARAPANIRLQIRKDTGSDHYQWFYFRVTGARDTDLALSIDNASGASYPRGWEGYRAVASYDQQRWFRVPTQLDSGKLRIRHRPTQDGVYYAYFAPYSMERHRALVARAQARPGVRLEVVGQSLDGQDLDLLVLSEASSAAPGEPKKRCWIWARQHPGETMAEWLVEGLVDALLDENDPVARAVLRKADVYVVPNMNPDGSSRGHLRCNAIGTNLNREWQEPSLERSPEVYRVRNKMQEVGVDFGLDVHGDEALPYNFISGIDGIPSLSPKQRQLMLDYSAALLAASPDFQVEQGYPVAPAGRANLAMGANWVGERFGCLAMTLEMPFKDTAPHGHPDGWSPARARAFGRAQLVALGSVAERL